MNCVKRLRQTPTESAIRTKMSINTILHFLSDTLSKRLCENEVVELLVVRSQHVAAVATPGEMAFVYEGDSLTDGYYGV